MYICEICSTPFDEPLTRRSQTIEDGRIMADVEVLCPICGSPHFQDADLCPKCREWKPRQDRLCHSCRADLLRRFAAFADSLTEEEEDQLDSWLDGDTITNRRKWT